MAEVARFDHCLFWPCADSATSSDFAMQCSQLHITRINLRSWSAAGSEPLRTKHGCARLIAEHDPFAAQRADVPPYRFADPISQRAWEKAMSRHPPDHNSVVQIKVKLLGVTKPPVWRRVQVRADTRLDQLHEIIQVALGWENSHMHSFSFASREFGLPDPELGFSDEHRVKLGELIAGVGDRFRYTYDFGDGWEHEILVEELLDADPETLYPVLIAAKGACPPEDCGGAWGYATLRQILADPSHGEHQEMLEWLGLDNASEFDPNDITTDGIEYELALSDASQ
ncbi:MAG: plasmid pRiA4b ORF-3 family protein [Gaiellaceae bacterium]